MLSLAAGIWIGHTLVSGMNPLTGLGAGLDGIVNVFTDPGDARVLIFTLLVGALIATIEHSGGVRGFVHYLETRHWVHNRRRAQWLAWGTGLVIFVESSITLLVAGSVSRPLFDRYQVSREKLAYLIDATSAPVCILIPLNAWGACLLSRGTATDLHRSRPSQSLPDRRRPARRAGGLEVDRHRAHAACRGTDAAGPAPLAGCDPARRRLQ